jgi:hypothetical protein
MSQRVSLPIDPAAGGNPDDSLRVTSVEIRIDAETLDRLFVVHCESAPPVKLRVNALDLAVIITALGKLTSHSMN